jgi:predicted amidophosphoribosyltransferase
VTVTWAEHSAKRKAAGLCPQCGEKPDMGKTYCLSCRKARRKRQKKVHDDGKCVTCGKELGRGSKWHCKTCYDKVKEKQRKVMRERRTKLVAMGLTTRGKPRQRPYHARGRIAVTAAGGR